ncbi:hypothetical protein [Pararhodobacter oceanensis]|uniref:Uncharacterized protein n=1 Tax=Pararhodobacter oceanensis TaxID=2172121 RepID=A0A2T8HYV5_9RHOB|nr:hypothetical protein [Pararhodobacter oceanensis]PVH30617.1 hypothetical protein DDE20_03605 [Pararhodobacter oceanensis]
MKPTIKNFVCNEFGGVPLNIIALTASVFGASVFGLGKFVDQARAQTMLQTEISLVMPLQELHMTRPARQSTEAALRAMDDATLSLAYARIHATFREYIGRDDLTVARALVDYAMLTEAELHARGVMRPGGTDSAIDMLTTYQLVL